MFIFKLNKVQRKPRFARRESNILCVSVAANSVENGVYGGSAIANRMRFVGGDTAGAAHRFGLW